jgi:hypothetical protein
MARAKAEVVVRKTDMPVPADLMEKIRADMAAQAAQVVVGGNRIKFSKTTGKEFVFPDKSEVKEFEGIVVAFTQVQVMYDAAFEEGKNNNIVCYASAVNPPDLAPMAGCPDPQAESCAKCPHSKFVGSGKDAKKPACGLRRHLAIMMEGVDDLLIMDLPVLSAKEFDKYSQSTMTLEDRPIYGVVTKFTFDPAVRFSKPLFSLVDKAHPNVMAQAYTRRDEAWRMLLSPPTFTAAEELPQGKAAVLAAAKKRAK